MRSRQKIMQETSITVQSEDRAVGGTSRFVGLGKRVRVECPLLHRKSP